MLKSLSPSHARGLLLLGGLIWATALAAWLLSGPGNPAPRAKGGWRVVGVEGPAERPGLYLCGRRQNTTG